MGDCGVGDAPGNVALASSSSPHPPSPTSCSSSEEDEEEDEDEVEDDEQDEELEDANEDEDAREVARAGCGEPAFSRGSCASNSHSDCGVRSGLSAAGWILLRGVVVFT